jgi:hypothetical protein
MNTFVRGVPTSARLIDILSRELPASEIDTKLAKKFTI